MKRLLTLVLTLFFVVSAQQVSAYFMDFESEVAGTPVGDLTLNDVSFTGEDWAVVDLSQASHPPHTLSGNTLGGCTSALGIDFATGQKTIAFDFLISSDFTDAYLVTVDAYRNGALVASDSFQGAFQGGDYLFPEGYAHLTSQQPFDSVTITHNAPTNCLYLDNLSTTRGQAAKLGVKKIGQVRVTAPGTALYDAPNGGVVRDAAGQELWIPNAHHSGVDVYDVLAQVEVDGETWVQIFVGSADAPWVKLDDAVSTH